MAGNACNLPIGIFDSGVGGISVLSEMLKLLPDERFIYFADSYNAPYGVKSSETVAELSLSAARFLLTKDIKALVVACNTATAVAVSQLRAELSIPVIGMEPALKPAVELGKEGKILVMATPVTLKQDKFNLLLHRFDEQARVIPKPCPGLVELVEQGRTNDDAIEAKLEALFKDVQMEQVAVVVLGCTHYVFIREAINKFLMPGTPIIDGNCGTAKHLKKVLTEMDCLAPAKDEAAVNGAVVPVEGAVMVNESRVEVYTSGEADQVVPLCTQLLKGK